MAREYAVIGKSIPRVDSPGKSTGESQYIADMALPGMLYGKLLRSPHSHANIINIDTSKAEALPGVKAVITGKDTLGIKIGPLRSSRDRQPITVEKVRFIGECVAAVAAIDEDTAEEALDLIKVDYEILPAVYDPEEALKSGAPQIHAHSKDNLSLSRYWNLGDVDVAFKEAAYVREDVFTTPAVVHGHIETDGCIAQWDAAGRLTVWATTQVPFYLRRDLSFVLDIPYSKIRIIKVTVGGSFGGKTEMFDHHLAASVIAKRTGKPVKIILTKTEEFIAGLRRIPTKMWMKMGVKKDGTILALESKIITDGGAYMSVGPVTIYNHGLAHMLPYKVPNFKHEALRVYTNNPVAGPKRGHGQIQVRFAIESQLDMVAEALGIDPVDIRLKNALHTGDVTISKLKISTSGLEESIKKCAEGSGWSEKRGKGNGIKGVGIGSGGFACGPRTAALSDSSAIIKINEDGGAIVITGASDIGQGSSTILAQIVAEVLGLTVDDINVVSGDTDTTPYDPGTYGSRVTFYAGNACKMASEDIRSKLAAAAAKKLEVKAEDLVFRDRWVYPRQHPDRRISFAELVRMVQVSSAEGVLIGKATYYPAGVDWPDPKNSYVGNIADAYSFASQVAEVEVDPETGKYNLVRMTMGDDCGYPINVMSAEGQVEGSVSNGQGELMCEEVELDEGRVCNPGYRGYQMPRSLDTPEMKTIHIETNDPNGPFGAKEVGEGFIISTPGAIANAIHDATGVWIKDLPITSNKVYRAMKEAREKGGTGQ
ncbi:MAG: molybdopterin-dependent oxidoreductase [Dehalococcoidia bacterium]|nr:molybdopterin-dependent oxidoreductase [Dehalococcoidia bacterium]